MMVREIWEEDLDGFEKGWKGLNPDGPDYYVLVQEVFDNYKVTYTHGDKGAPENTIPSNCIKELEQAEETALNCIDTFFGEKPWQIVVDEETAGGEKAYQLKKEIGGPDPKIEVKQTANESYSVFYSRNGDCFQYDSAASEQKAKEKIDEFLMGFEEGGLQHALEN